MLIKTQDTVKGRTSGFHNSTSELLEKAGLLVAFQMSMITVLE